MRFKTLTLPVAAALALLAGGCGGGGGGSATSTDSAATIVPANAVVYISLNVDSDSDQWKKAEALVDKFPDGRKLVRQAVQELEEDQSRDWENDIRPALGDQVAIAILDFKAGEPVFVAILKPDDKDKLNALLKDEDSEPTVTREIDGWTVISDKESSLDAVATGADGETLADSDSFQQTIEDLGGDTLAAVYVNGPRVIDVFRGLAAAEGEAQTFQQLFSQGLGRLESAGTALLARDDGVEWKAFAKGEPGENANGGVGFQESFDTTLDEKVPSGALAFLSFSGGNYQQQLNQLTPQQESMLRRFEATLGFSVEELAGLLSSEGGLYLRPGSPFPEGTLILRTDDEAKARALLDRLAQRLARLGGAQVQKTQIAGVPAGQVQVGSLTVAYAVFDGMAVVTTAPAGIEALKEGGESLSDDAAYKDAREAAGVPDQSSGFFYWNIEDTVPLLRSYAQLSDQSIPPQVWTNLRPLRSLVFYGAGEKGEARFSAFLRIQ
jgi:hypothetical protein